jgi:hypothetical protein
MNELMKWSVIRYVGEKGVGDPRGIVVGTRSPRLRFVEVSSIKN